MNAFVSAYAVVVGTFMLSFLGLLVARGQAGLDRRPWDMGFHLAAEFATAFLLTASGLGGLLGWPDIIVLGPAAFGMLLYSTVNSPGFYAGTGNRPMVAMFIVLTGLTIAAVGARLLSGV